VVIQDAMGWLDYHLHRFTIPHPRTKKPMIFGIHNLHQDCEDPPGWATQAATMLPGTTRRLAMSATSAVLQLATRRMDEGA
jgi:hypothetical protein